MKYANEAKTAVIANHPKTGAQWTVPRGHRFWFQWGIDKAEEQGLIEPADIIEMPTA